MKPGGMRRKKKQFILVTREEFLRRLFPRLIRRGELDDACSLLAVYPSRNAILRLAISQQQGFRGAQQMLRLSQNRPLCTKLMRDAAIAFCLEKKKDLYSTQSFLRHLNLMPL